MTRRLLAYVGVLVCGASLGVAVSYAIARNVQMNEGRSQLRGYAARMESAGEQIARETDDAVAKVKSTALPFCSDQELAFLRNYVFNAAHIRDIGRNKDGKLYCTTGIGRLAAPVKTTAPDLDVGGMKVYTRVPIMIGNGTMGFITEVDGVSVVMNPASFASLDEAPMQFSGLLYVRQTGVLLQEFGHAAPMTAAQVIAGKYVELDGVFYQPMCAPHAMLCVVVSEPRAAMQARSRPLFVSLLTVGGLLGSALGLILIQSYQGRRSMESQLRRAIRRGELTVVYQPIVSLATGAIVGAEALVRWINEDGASVRPDVFVTIAEERGFVSEITRLMARRVSQEMGDLLGEEKLRVTLNIASQDLADPEFAPYLDECLKAARVAPSSVGLELTERSTADHEMAVVALTHLKNTGHVVYVDDFGTGYSSLAYLHELHVDAIKVDRAFTRTVGTEAVTASVVPQILAMARELDLLVVVEGIETVEQAEYFRAAGRGILGQGWLFGKPVPAGEFRKLLR